MIAGTVSGDFDSMTHVNLLAKGLDHGKVWGVDLLIEFEGTKHVLISNGFRAISQVPTELSEYLAWTVSQLCLSYIGCTFDDVRQLLQVGVFPDQGVEWLFQRGFQFGAEICMRAKIVADLSREGTYVVVLQRQLQFWVLVAVHLPFFQHEIGRQYLFQVGHVIGVQYFGECGFHQLQGV